MTSAGQRLRAPRRLRVPEGVVALDVSSLGDPWIEGEEIPSRFVKLERLGEDGTLRVTVCFVKGGAADYLVEWVVKGGKSLRMKIESLGDTLPDWVREKK